jgi:hypothetical protein
MTCIECGDQFYQGEVKEVSGGVMCWACAAYVAQETRKVEEEEAFLTLSTNELVSGGYIDAATMNELFAPWGEVEAMPLAA